MKFIEILSSSPIVLLTLLSTFCICSLTHYWPVFPIIYKPVNWFVLQINWLVSFFPIIYKPVNWFVLQINWLVSIWWGTLVINGLKSSSESRTIAKCFWIADLLMLVPLNVKEGWFDFLRLLINVRVDSHFLLESPVAYIFWFTI